MSKLEKKYNSIVDETMATLYRPIIPSLYKLGVTPNMITTSIIRIQSVCF